ncbi:MAG TPA: tetratricopeptide repeat protein [Pyrinomonadaceae bacterium]|nr:tetratricopeptide repeat protein [Pyrinomonadaceae bacterium]
MKLTSLLPILIIGLFSFSPFSSIAHKSAQETKTAEEFYEKARALEKQQKYREAIEIYTVSIGLDPGNPTAYVGRGDSNFGLENFREAIEDYGKAIRIYTSWEPEKWEPKKSKVKAGEGGGNVTLEQIEALQAHPEAYARRVLGSVYLKRGLARDSLGDRVGACTDFRESCQWDEIDCKDINKLCSMNQRDQTLKPLEHKGNLFRRD